MARSVPLFIKETNLSQAWAKAFLAVMAPGVQKIAPLVVTITGFTNDQLVEIETVRRSLDNCLTQNGQFSCDTVAGTLFPRSLWNPNRKREELFERYLRILPHLKKVEPRNRYGLYFERLIAFGNSQKNQLDHIIRTYHRGNHRPSALQASLFMPTHDHTHQIRRGFPCMQHVAFTLLDGGGLAVTGFYASQYLFERAYGNYLGLCHLGQFMAHEIGVQFTQMTCVAAVAGRGSVPKKKIKMLIEELEENGHLFGSGVAETAH